MKNLLIYFFAFVLLSCATQKTARLKIGQDNFLIDAPKGFRTKKFIHHGGFTEYNLLYKNGAVIYITNDYISGGEINTQKSEQYGQAIYIRILANDTLDIKGNVNGLFWRERKENNIVVGYINVPENLKSLFDAALLTVRRK